MRRLLCVAPTDLCGSVLLEHELNPSASWLGLVMESLKVMSAMSIVDLGDPEVEHLAWREHLCNCPKAWSYQVDTLARWIDSYAVPAPPPFVPLEEVVQYPCPFCDQSFCNKTVFNGHLWAAHGHRSITKFLAPGGSGICVFCMHQYHDRRGLVKHLDRPNGRCLRLYQQHVEPMSVAEVEALDAADLKIVKNLKSKGFCATYNPCRPIRIPGPRIRCFYK